MWSESSYLLTESVLLQYNRHHISLLLNLKNLVMLKLHHEYHVSDVKNKKLFIQWVNCFSIKQQISLLAYKLKLSANMKIHSVIFITNLESVLPDENLYKQSHNDHLLSVEKDWDINDEWKSFYIKKLLDCHLCCYKCDKQIIEYLVKWTDYRPEFNEWYEEDLLDNAVKLMLEYEIHQNNDSDHIAYLHKLLTESLMISTKLLLKKQCHKSKQTA